MNSFMCVSTREHPELRAGCFYYTEEDNDMDGVGVFRLKDGTVEKVEGLWHHWGWPPPAWFTPPIPR
jgi:hypothetical protein